MTLSDATPPSSHFTTHLISENLAYESRETMSIAHTTVHRFSLPPAPDYSHGGCKLLCAPVIDGLPAPRGYATMRVFWCIIWVSWDLIKITASKIPSKWNCSQQTMVDTSSRRLFLFSAHQQSKANPCFHDGRQGGHKVCCFLTFFMLLRYVTLLKYAAN